eukprot:SAG31_NODE_2881_length_4958_cov_3.159086_4_plen_245_part_00
MSADGAEGTSSDRLTSAGAQEWASQCAICLEPDLGTPALQRAEMPCCARQSSTIAYCVPCIRIICERAPGSVGQCPTCRSFVRIDATGSVHRAVQVAQCLLCRQERVIADEGCCGQCLLGKRLPLRYECERCHQLQRIPHPMWKYQPSPGEYGNDTWACRRRCGSQTRWRVYPADAHYIPPEEAPESWGRRDEWLAAVRAARMQQISQAQASQGGAAVSLLGHRSISANGVALVSRHRSLCVSS